MIFAFEIDIIKGMEEKYTNKTERTYSAYGMSLKNPLLWIAVLFVAASLASRAAYHLIDGTRALPGFYRIAATAIEALVIVLFAAALIKNGEKRLYLTAKPVLFYAVFLIIRQSVYFANRADGFALEKGRGWLLAALIAGYLLLAILYRLAVNTGGRSRIRCTPRRIAALAAFFAALILQLAFNKRILALDDRLLMYDIVAILFALCAALSVLIGMKKTVSSRPLPMAGDRNDGRRVRSLDPLNGVAVYIMPDRTAASNLFRDCFECSNAEAYIRAKREAGLDSFGYTHLLLAAYARTVAKLPAVNRFISGQRIYSRGDSIEISMAIKKDMSTDGSETIINVCLSPDDTAETVYEKLNREIEAVKNTSELDSSFDKLAGFFNLIPGVFLKLTVHIIKTMDYFGKLPKFILKLSPFHGSMFITSMGSLGIPPIYHHLYDFGNIPVFLAFGMKRRENEVQQDGSIVQKKYIDFTVNTDERICDGFYFATAFKYFKRLLGDPQRLDAPPETVIDDIE